MEFGFNREEEKLRDEVRNFLEDEIETGTFRPTCNGWSLGYSPEFSRRVAKKGWIGMCFPTQLGGGGRRQIERFIVYEEMLRYGAPTAYHYFADALVGPLIVAMGTDEQKRELLPKILNGNASFALGVSEPQGAAVDGSIQTYAVEDGDDYVINGQKVWSSHAHHADYYLVLVKTGINVHEESEFSLFLINMGTPGITINPLKIMSGDDPFCEVFLDEVRVSKKWMVGSKGRARETLSVITHAEWGELARVEGFAPLWQVFIQFARDTTRDGIPLINDSAIRSRIAQMEIEREIGRLLCLRVALTIDRGVNPSALEAPTLKVYGGDFQQRQINFIMETLGLHGLLMPSPTMGDLLGSVARWYLYSKGDSIRGGCAERLWSGIAERALGLPSHLGPEDQRPSFIISPK